jgi:hypothetical protein
MGRFRKMGVASDGLGTTVWHLTASSIIRIAFHPRYGPTSFLWSIMAFDKSAIHLPNGLPKSRKLTDLEEKDLIKRILELDSLTFLPRPRSVEKANQLLTERDEGIVGKNWVANFAKRRPELAILILTFYSI